VAYSGGARGVLTADLTLTLTAFDGLIRERQMARRPKAEAKAPTVHASAKTAGVGRVSTEAELAAQEIDRIIERLDVEISKAQRTMDELLARPRTTRIAA
jgi:hypothetical protein